MHSHSANAGHGWARGIRRAIMGQDTSGAREVGSVMGKAWSRPRLGGRPGSPRRPRSNGILYWRICAPVTEVTTWLGNRAKLTQIRLFSKFVGVEFSVTKFAGMFRASEFIVKSMLRFRSLPLTILDV